jgi:hypothetical protein
MQKGRSDGKNAFSGAWFLPVYVYAQKKGENKFSPFF